MTGDASPDPDDPKIKRIVFDEDVYHALDHRIGSGRCRSFTPKASVRTHASYWWQYKRDDDLAWLYRLVFCWWGHHKIVIWHRKLPTRSANRRCAWCSFGTGWVIRK